MSALSDGVISGKHLRALQEAVQFRVAGAQEGDGIEDLHEALQELYDFLFSLPARTCLARGVGYAGRGARVVEIEAKILPEQRDKRQALTSQIDVAICFSGGRITAGVYQVRIERVGK